MADAADRKRLIILEDTIVSQRHGRQVFGIVTRCWGDMDDQAIDYPDDPAPLLGPDRVLKPGEVEVLFTDGERQIMQQETAQLADRNFVVGDLVRQRQANNEPTLSGIVVGIETQVKLQGIFSHQPVADWIPTDELVNAVRIGRGDHVAAGDWVGLVEEVFEEAVVATAAGGTFRICDVGAGLLSVGSSAQQLLSERHLPSFLQVPSGLDTILESQQTVAAVNWHAVNQRLSSAEHEARPRPKRFWADVHNLSLLRTSADHLHFVGDRVVFRNPLDAVRYNAASSQRLYAANVFEVTESRSTIEMLWQNGTRSSFSAHELEPCGNVDDEHDVWPGDLAIFVGGEDKKLVVVQSMDAEERTAEVKHYGSEERETVSVLELDPHGPPPFSVGVRRGDIVMITAETNPDFPTIGKIGETELEFPTEEALRNQLSGFGMAHAHDDSEERLARRPKTGAEIAAIDWYGEVRDLTLEGQALVRLPSGELRTVAPDRLVIFDDGFDAALGWGGEDPGAEDEMDEDAHDHAHHHHHHHHGHFHHHHAIDPDARSDDSWETDEPDEFMDADEDEPPATAVPAALAPPQPSASGTATPQSMDLDLPPTVAPPTSAPEADDGPWQRFLILEEAPTDHHFLGEPSQAPSRAFSQRVQREYKVLEESLPDNILVRAYEDRIDLMRCLIIGPTGTPYEDAPFLFDIFLPPSKYPSEPPLVHFHSWTNGAGRVNPNLYMEGKLCLSLLGTWSGEKTESWNPSRSSVFQVLVSIQGLVLVKEPYYLEPGFEKQRDTPDGARASALYAERTWVLARAFIRRAIERPPAGLAGAIRHLYFPPGRDRLRAVVAHIQRALATVDAPAPPAPDATTATAPETNGDVEARWPESLTKGSAIPLRRTLTALEAALAKGPPDLPEGEEV